MQARSPASRMPIRRFRERSPAVRRYSLAAVGGGAIGVVPRWCPVIQATARCPRPDHIRPGQWPGTGRRRSARGRRVISLAVSRFSSPSLVARVLLDLATHKMTLRSPMAPRSISMACRRRAGSSRSRGKRESAGILTGEAAGGQDRYAAVQPQGLADCITEVPGE
jgi:hypothetical protein